MDILVIDGMGGGIGKAVIEQIKPNFPHANITAVGTNALATSAMLKAGADQAATGENALIYNCTAADYIIGAVGIALANSMYGEISPNMATAVATSRAHKILIPMDKCITILGTEEKPIGAYIQEITHILRGQV